MKTPALKPTAQIPAADRDTPPGRSLASRISLTVVFLWSWFGIAAVFAQWSTGQQQSGRGGSAVAHVDVVGLLVEAGLLAVLPLAAALSPFRRTFGVALPPTHPVLRTIRATVLVFTAQWVVGMVNAHLSGDDPLQRGLDHAFGNDTVGQRAAVALNAAIGEEVRDIVVPTVVVVLVLALVQGRGHPVERIGAGVATVTKWRLWVSIACFTGIVTRVIDHLYQGHVSAIAASVWGAALLAIYLVYRSVVPLMLGHFAFDVLIGSSAWSADTAYWTLLAGAWIVVVTYILERRQASDTLTAV